MLSYFRIYAARSPVRGGQAVKFLPPDLRHLPLPVHYHDAAIVVVDKLPDFLSVPGRSPGTEDCVVARVQEVFPHATGSLAAHRLDMATSGLMVLGLTPEAHRHLSIQFGKAESEKNLHSTTRR